MKDKHENPHVVLFALWLTVFSVSSQTLILAPILPRIAEQLGVPEARLGVLVTGYAVAVGVVALGMGPISDRFGRRRMLLLGTGFMSVALALHWTARSFLMLLLVRILAGAGGGMLTGAPVAYIGDYFPRERRGWANGWVMSGAAAGQILAIPLATVLAGRFGFRLPFLGFAALMGITFALVWRVLPQRAAPGGVARLTARGALRHYAVILRDRRSRGAVAAFFLMFLGTALYVLYLPTWLETARGATAGQVAMLFLAGGVATVLVGPLAGKLSDRGGRRLLIVGCSTATGVVMLATTPLVKELWTAFVLFFVLMALFAARGSPLQALVTEIVPGEERGSLMSLAMALGQVGSGVGGWAAGLAYGAFGYQSNTLLGAAAALLMGLVVWRFLAEPEWEPTRRTRATASRSAPRTPPPPGRC